MNAAQVERLIPRNVALVRLSEIRYGIEAVSEGRLLSQPSLWRWCDLAEIETGKVEFTESEFNQLAAIAVAYRRGLSTQQILEKLTHEQTANSSNAGKGGN